MASCRVTREMIIARARSRRARQRRQTRARGPSRRRRPRVHLAECSLASTEKGQSEWNPRRTSRRTGTCPAVG